MSTLATIRDNVRANLSAPGTQAYLDTDLNRYIGEAYKEYVQPLIDSGQGYFEETINLGFTANQNYVDVSGLTPPFFQIARLERNTTTGTVPMKQSERRFTPNLVLGTGSGNLYLPDYRMQQLKIILEPIPLFTETPTSLTGLSVTGLRLDYNYLPTFPSALSSDSFTFDASFPTIFEPLIEIYATIAALESKDGAGGVSDINSFRVRLERWEDRFKNSIKRYEFPDMVQYAGVDYNDLGRWD